MPEVDPESQDGSAAIPEMAVKEEEIVEGEKEKDAVESIESRIDSAMCSRVQHFLEQADSLTFEGVRRLLEKDLGLEIYALDVHKRFIKQRLSKCLDSVDTDNFSKSSGKTVEKAVSSIKAEVVETHKKHQTKKDIKESSSADENMEDSPVMGLLSGSKSSKSKTVEAQSFEKKEVPDEPTIKKAIWKRASYLNENAGNVSMAGARRLLEEDLGLDQNALDHFKKFINAEIEKVLHSPVPEADTNIMDKTNATGAKASKKNCSKGSLDSSDWESDDVNAKKKVAMKRKFENSDELKKRKRSVKEVKVSTNKLRKLADTLPDENSNSENDDDASEDSHSESSAKKPLKKKDVTTPAYGRHVEHLKSVIKSCGMSVPPSVYKRVKQVAENKREAFLVKELEGILSKEGLSANPGEKEIKEVKRRKERAKELEGIDMSNIVSSTRRRSTMSFVAPPKPKIAVKNDEDDVEGTDNCKDDEENSNDEENSDDEGDTDGDSKSEEIGEDDDEDSD